MKAPRVRPERTYTVAMRDEGGSTQEESFTVDAGTEVEQDTAAVELARKYAEDWAREGDWGDDGAIVTVYYTLSDKYDEWLEESVEVEIEPDHDALIAAAGGDTDCEHEWTREGEGGCDQNPGIWSLGGTTVQIRSHCTRCGLIRTEIHHGVQRNPGQADEVRYELNQDATK
jgi:hypothetical protein